MIPETNAAIRRIGELEAEREKLLGLLRQVRRGFVGRISSPDEWLFGIMASRGVEAIALLDRMDAALGTNAAGKPAQGRL